jgi:hypothetical protein
MLWRACATGFLAVAATAAVAGEAALWLGWDDVDGSDGAAAGALEVRGGDTLALGPATLAPFAAVMVDADRDLWAGVGVFAWVDLGSRGVRLEASLAPGLYARGEGQDLGGPFEIRSAVGVSAPLGDGWRAGATAAHISNASLYDENPGANLVMATLARAF